MNFKFDDKDYDSDKLSEQGKIVLQKLQNIALQKQQLSIQFTDLEILQKHYSNLLKKELPQEEEVKENKTGA